MATVKIKGIASLRKRFEKAPFVVRQILEQELGDIAQSTLEVIKARTPTETGDIRDGWKATLASASGGSVSVEAGGRRTRGTRGRFSERAVTIQITNTSPRANQDLGKGVTLLKILELGSSPHKIQAVQAPAMVISQWGHTAAALAAGAKPSQWGARHTATPPFFFPKGVVVDHPGTPPFGMVRAGRDHARRRLRSIRGKLGRRLAASLAGRP